MTPRWLTPGWLMCFLLFQAAWLVAAPAQAGQVAIQDNKACAISVAGRIEDGDDLAFDVLATACPNALVVLSGPGGKVAPALAIGRNIRARGLRTLVPAGAACASACSLIWLAGTPRLLAADARIGFHALSALRPGAPAVETHAFDPELVRYLTGLGYALDVTATVVNTPSASVHWRDAIELNANGIATQPYP